MLDKAGMSPTAIGRELGISRQRAWQVLHAKKRQGSEMLYSGEAAKLLGLHPETMRRWADRGIIKSYRLGPRQNRRYRREDIEAFIENGEKGGLTDMKTAVLVSSDQLNKEDMRALLQAIRSCEVANFPDKEIRITVEVPELTADETEDILASIKPPFKYGPKIIKRHP